jgi:hypothetical protein
LLSSPEAAMKRHWPLEALAITLAVLFVAGIALRLMSRKPPPPGISEANCARIKPGMRKEQVEEIFGGPPGIYEGGRLLHAGESLDTGRGVLFMWVDEKGSVYVWFHHDGTVIRTPRYFYDMPAAR